jgi:hypothetical protein
MIGGVSFPEEGTPQLAEMFRSVGDFKEKPRRMEG